MPKHPKKARKSSTVLVTLSLILFTYNAWEEYQETYGDDIRPIEKSNVEKIRRCRDPDYGHRKFECPDCGESKFVGFSCKSRLCTSCGNRATNEWSEIIHMKLLNVRHRHIVLTVPERLWLIISKNPPYQKAMFNAAKTTIEDMVRYSNKKKRKLKIGLILIIQTYGADLKVNVHLHGLLAEGGFDKNGDWINVSFINYDSWRRKWQYEMLTELKKCMPNGEKTNRFIDALFKQYRQGFVIYGDSRFSKSEAFQFIRYIGRYVRHPPIAESRIISYDKNYVRFWYRESGSKKKIIVKMSKLEFIHKLLCHIPEKNFKVVRCYGIYARRAKKVEQLEFEIHTEDDNPTLERFTWRAWMIKAFHRDPLLCRKCGSEMVLVDVSYYGYDNTKDKPPPSLGVESSSDSEKLCQQEKIKIVIFAIKEIEDEKGADVEELITKCSKLGIHRDNVWHILKQLEEIGEAYQPAIGKISYIRF